MYQFPVIFSGIVKTFLLNEKAGTGLVTLLTTENVKFMEKLLMLDCTVALVFTLALKYVYVYYAYIYKLMFVMGKSNFFLWHEMAL